MNSLGSNKYVSLKTAAELYGYTRDHLGLMIRQGKLNGVKLGSYYVTTNEWMSEYVKKFAALNHPTLKNKLSNKFLTGLLSSKGGLISARQNVSKIFPGNFTGVAKPIKEKVQKYDTDNSLKEIILKELEQYANPFGTDAAPRVKANQSGPSIQTARVKNSLSTPPDGSYVILPIRKMKNIEREEVLKKVS